MCQAASDAPSIFELGAPSAVDAISVERLVGSTPGAEGTVRFVLRNESGKDLNTLCAVAVFRNQKGRPQAVRVSLAQAGQGTGARTFEDGSACLTIQPGWKAFEARSFEVALRAGSDLIPLTGFVSLSTSAQYKEASSSAPASKSGTKHGRKKGAHNNKGVQATPQPTACTATSRPVTRAVLLLPMLDSGWFLGPMAAALVVGVGFFAIAWIALHKSLGKMVGGPQWNFSTSFATNFTVGTGLASFLLGSNFITDALHYMTKLQYGILGALFAAVLLLGPALFWFFGTPKEITTQAGAKTTVSFAQGWLLLVVVALMTGAVIGQLFTVGLAVAELWFRGVMGDIVVWGAEGLLVLVAVGTVVCAGRTVSACLADEPEKDETDRSLQSLQLKLASRYRIVGGVPVASELVTQNEMDALEGMARERKPAAVWRMF